MTLSPLDWMIYALLAAACIIGYRRGFIAQLVSLLGLFVAWLCAFFFYDDVAPWIGKMVPSQAFAAYPKYEFAVKVLKLDVYIVNTISFVLIFLAVKVALMLIGHVLSIIAKVPGLNLINRCSGAMLAGAETFVLLLVIVHVMAVLPTDGIQKLLAESQAAQWLYDVTPTLWESFQSLPQIFAR